MKFIFQYKMSDLEKQFWSECGVTDRFMSTHMANDILMMACIQRFVSDSDSPLDKTLRQLYTERMERKSWRKDFENRLGDEFQYGTKS